MEEHKYLNAFWLCERITGQRLQQIRDWFPDLATAWRADTGELIAAGIKPDAAAAITHSRANIDPEREWERLQNEGVRIIARGDAEYPALLREISSPPAILYFKGDFAAVDRSAVAVVGSRTVTQYGRQVAEKIVEPLAAAGVVIVSGLALGADSEAHKAALAGNGTTWAVLANGLDSVYPSNNTKLAQQILKSGGALISEYSLGSEPLPQKFPARNRIVAGLALGALIIEAKAKSGSLITAQMALDTGREVFAVPGSIFSQESEGTNNLFKKSAAHPVTNADEILSILNLNKKGSQKIEVKSAPTDPTEAQIFALLSHEPISHDDLVEKSQLNASEVASALTLMEMRGLARAVGGGLWVRG